MIVVDASAALAWCFEDERTPAIIGVFERIAEEGGVAPQIWPLEVLNGLLMAERRRRFEPHQRVRLVEALRDLPLRIDEETGPRLWSQTLTLAITHRLTVYDATYLELAIRLKVPLASRDAALKIAASRAGIVVVPC